MERTHLACKEAFFLFVTYVSANEHEAIAEQLRVFVAYNGKVEDATSCLRVFVAYNGKVQNS